MTAWILTLLNLVPPAFPLVQWGIAARMVPGVQTIAKGLYILAWWNGVTIGFGWGWTIGLAVGGALGVVSTVIVITLIYWSFFKKVRQPRCDDPTDWQYD